MLDSIFIILLIVGIIMLVLMVEWESMALAGLSIAIFMTLAISIHQIEIPYQYTDPLTGTIVESTQSIESMFPLSLLFYGIAFIIFIYLLVNLVLPYVSESIKNKRML